jgi:hypothetical protein
MTPHQRHLVTLLGLLIAVVTGAAAGALAARGSQPADTIRVNETSTEDGSWVRCTSGGDASHGWNLCEWNHASPAPEPTS